MSKKQLHSLHPFFRCVDSALFADFVSYVLNTKQRELFSFPSDEQLNLFFDYVKAYFC